MGGMIENHLTNRGFTGIIKSVQNYAMKPNRALSNTSPRAHKCLRSCWAHLHFFMDAFVSQAKHCPNVLLNCVSPGGDVPAFFSPPACNSAVMNPLPFRSFLIQLECSLFSMKPVWIILKKVRLAFIAVLDHSSLPLLPAQP